MTLLTLSIAIPAHRRSTPALLLLLCRSTLDYVWLSPHWAVSEALELPYRFDPGPPPARTTPGGGVAGGGGSSEEDSSSCGASDLPPIPAPGFPSDHLALGFTLHLLPPGAVN